MQQVLIIVGPTASGKSALGVELARHFGGEIVSADSRQVYRGLDIGTGKVTMREMKGVPHHLLDVASPKSRFTAHRFRELAERAIRGIGARGKLPIVVGGTGFYVDILLGRGQLPDVPPDPEFRKNLESLSTDELFLKLCTTDARRAETIDKHNRPRLIRALEIANVLGSVPEPAEKTPPYDALWIGTVVPKDVLEQKIRVRLAARLRRGMIREAIRLHDQGLSFRRMEELGLEYRHLARFLTGTVSREEMEQNLARDILHYAKRQLTYWRRNKEIHWYAPDNLSAIRTHVASWLTR